MPNALVKRFAKKTGKSVKDVEKIWIKAKAIAIQSITKKDDGSRREDDPSFFPLVTGILKKMLKI